MVLAWRASLIALVVAGGAAARDDFVPQRPEFEAIARTLLEGTNTYLGLATIDRLRESLADPQLGEQRRLGLRGELVLKLLQAGRVDDAVAEMDALFTQATSRPEMARMVALHRLRGLTYLRKAEIANCVQRHNAQCCIFPLADGGLHDVRGPAAEAMASFEKLLQISSGDLKARWLLNISAMALGEWPGGLAPDRLIPPEAFASEHDIGRFPDVAPELGVDTFNLCGGVIVEDFDNDGHLDIVTSTFDPAGPLTFYRATGDGRYEDRSAAARADDQLGGLNIVGADYDDDGDEDVLILRGAWLFDDGQIRNSLLRNDGGTFTDVTRAVGLAEPARPTQAAAWGDFDNDGDLDLYVGNESRPRNHPEGNYPGQLFLNTGGPGAPRFTDAALEAGVTNDRYCKGVAAGDYDNDGDLDLYLSNVGPNRLYRNEADGTFTDVAEAAGVSEPAGRSFACWFFDYDNDGWLDLFVVGYQASIADLAAEALGLPHQAAYPRLYRNRGDGTFDDVTGAAGLLRVLLPMGANFGDLDNDGWLDMYLSTGDPDYQSLMPNVMLRNDGGRRFQDVTTSGGFGHLQKGHGVAFADLDGDGDQDIYHQLGGFFPGDAYHNALFRNPGHGNRFLGVRLRGTRSNRQGFGVRIRVVLETPRGRREIHRAAGSVSSFGGSPMRQEIGLGDALRIERLELLWPASGIRQVFDDVPLDARIEVTEGETTWKRLP